MKNLYIYTATFPYDTRESFLETEVLFLSKRFENIYFIPLSGHGTKKRDLPNNCHVLNPILKNKWDQYLSGFLNIWRVIPLYIADFFSNKVYKDRVKLKTWFISLILTSNYMSNRKVRSLLKTVHISDVFYFYWGKSANTIAPYFRYKVKMVSRFHGEWDLWEESYNDYAPIRQKVINSLDLVLPISQKGRLYIENKYVCGKVIISRLGTLYKGVCKKSNDGFLRIVSCSTVDSNKRVLYILEAIASIKSIQIEWTHIGDGEQFSKLKYKSEKLTSDTLNINLLGRLTNEEVLNYYVNNSVDVFINLSKSEGIPVTIMEAISFNIPIVATNVGSTSEIVNEQTGVLLNSNPSISEIKNAILSVSKSSFSSFIYWSENYNAEENYNDFIDQLLFI